MTISIWRYSHLALAVSSFLLVALAAITGIILALEPVSLKTQPYRVSDFNSITLAESIPAIKKNFQEITDLSVDANQFVTVKGINDAGDDVTVYVDPRSGKTLGIPKKQSAFFAWVTTLHRSLFLHEIGRLFVGITAFLLLLIATSGTVLIIQRQRGIKRFFTRIVRGNFAQYYHVMLGRLLLVPILIITISGTYLSLVRFRIIPELKVKQDINFDTIRSAPEKKAAEFDIFKHTLLSNVQSVEFPFSEDVEDYYTLKLKDREVAVNQLTGDILSDAPYPMATLLNNLSLELHTGRASGIWAIVLALASVNILFFIYSGFVMTLKRRSGRIRNKYSRDEARFIILVGSENGTTNIFAKALYQQLIGNGQRCYLTELNNYGRFPAAEHFIVFTATYGLGDAPTNAARFMGLLEKYPQQQSVQFSVLGFGSVAYPDFCQYAFEVNNVLSLQQWAVPLLEIHTVNDRSPEEFANWAKLWSQHTEIPLDISPALFQVKPKRLQTFTVTAKTPIAHEDGAFLIRLLPKRGRKFTSGDLLAIYPAGDHRERLYSIGKVNKELQLSVKLHVDGLGSGYLYKLEPGDTIKGEISANPHFNFPEKAPAVIMISNGTGIAPFLGMIDQNRAKVTCHLYCGFRGAVSFELYQDFINRQLAAGQLTTLQLAYSREGAKQYVKDLIALDEDLIADTLSNKGIIMLCGSLSMQQNIIEVLELICMRKNNRELSYYQSHQQILMDCY